MRLSSMVPRLTPPKIILTESMLPTFGQTCKAAVQSDSSSRQGEPSSEDMVEEGIPYGSMTNEIALSSLFSTSKKAPRAIFFGEQHHQPKVLSAQLQIIHQLFTSCKEPTKVHVVFEQWSLLDQPYLNNLNQQDPESFDPSRSDSNEKTSEGFDANHYLTIVKLVRELGGSVWAGFPPRSWARLISKAEGDDVFDQVKQLDQERYAAQGGPSDEKIIPPLSTVDYRHVGNISWSHRTYLKSMFQPQNRPQIPSQQVHSPPPEEKRGFLPAQAVKDTFLAHTMSNLLAKDESNIVLAVTGLGHCEWSFGAPQTLKSMSGIDSYIIVSKPDDSSSWKAFSSESEEKSRGATLDSSWNVKQADAIVVYEWVD